MTVTIYHNPRCSKSRQTLQLLEEKHINPHIIEYLKTPPDEATLKQIIDKLGIGPRELLRTGEKEYQEAGLADTSLSDEEIISKMIAYPKLIQRPIVVHGDKATIGRPPENVLNIL
jgi:arsenate reductase